MKLAALLLGLLLLGGRRSGLEDMSPGLQAMQRDDAQNPGLLWVEQGKALVSTQCLSCHGLEKLRDAATRFPAFDAGAGRVLDLAQRVNRCRKTQAWTHESEEMLAVTAYLGFLARGRPIQPAASAELSSAARHGERLFRQPMGQLGLSCAQCHDQSAGRRLAGSLIPQGHPTGYPIYRLEWQGMGSLQRRLRGCLTGVRAEPFAPDSPDWVALEAYLMQRAAGMPLETPAVRP